MEKGSRTGSHIRDSRSNDYTQRRDFSLDDTITFAQEGFHSSVDDAVVDEILRSISDQSATPVPNTPPRPTRQTYPTGETVSQRTRTMPPRGAVENSYVAAARAHHAQEEAQHAAQQREGFAQRATGPIPDPAYYAMRDPAQTQTFQPARPAHRDTDRIPTLVEEKPVRRKSAVGKVLTFLVAILVLVAIVLGVRMAYILGPSMGWNLPDLTQLPGISFFTGMLPEENLGETVGNETTEDTDADQTQDLGETPTTITLDQETLTMNQGDVVILTATMDTDWSGTVVWATSDENVATVTSIGANIAQVEYVGEGSCSIAAVVPAGVQQEGPSAYCRVTCGPAAEVEQPADTGAEETDDTQENTAVHVDVTLNREDFTLHVGERHQLMDENADQVTWTSSDESVATVDENGIVTAVSSGTATITATGPDGTSASAIARIKD